jgi:YebC/PmpR family DNA-binding regulatory protein
MAGHSHWAGIKHKKGANDAKRGKLFSKLAKHIMSAARVGGGDPDANLTLKYAIEQARAYSMPRDSIDRAIIKGTGGSLGVAQLEPITYEGYGPGGVALLVEGLTDNRNRTSSEIRWIFDTKGGNIGQPGCVSWLFEKKGLFVVPNKPGTNGDRLFEIALEANADDIQEVEGNFEITCRPEDFMAVKEALNGEGIEPEIAEISFLPKTRVPLGPEQCRKVLSLVDLLEDHDDVQAVHSNIDIPEEVLKELKAAG